MITALQQIASDVRKVVRKCDLLVTDTAVFEVRVSRLAHTGIALGLTPEKVADATEARLGMADDLGIMA